MRETMKGQALLQHLSDSIDRSTLSEPDPDLWEIAKRPSLGANQDSEKRRLRRHPVVVKVIVAPVDGELRLAGQPFVALSRNISFAAMADNMSAGGICLVHTNPAPSRLLFVGIEWHDGLTIKALLKVVINRRISRFFEI